METILKEISNKLQNSEHKLMYISQLDIFSEPAAEKFINFNDKDFLNNISGPKY